MKTMHGRNLSGAEMAEMLDEFCNSASDADIAQFVDTLVNRTHRTLQQRIMALMLKSIEAWAVTPHFDGRNEVTIKIAKKIVAATGDKYDRDLPLI